jgi:hypothetical protein
MGSEFVILLLKSTKLQAGLTHPFDAQGMLVLPPFSE